MKSLQRLLICCFIAALAQLCHGAPLRRGPPVGPYRHGEKVASSNALGRQLIDRCKVYFRNATLDHFSWVSTEDLDFLMSTLVKRVSKDLISCLKTCMCTI